MTNRPLTAQEVLVDLFGEAEFEKAILAGDDESAARLATDRLRDAGFVILDARDETARLRFALQRALRVADERAKEANALRQEVAGLRARLGD
jgi:hypothetical protein